MTKKLFALFLAVGMALTMVAALAEESVATPSDMYAYEENDGHDHHAYCTNPKVCHLCGASSVDTMIDHDDRIVGGKTGHYWTCARCGETSTEQAHWRNCFAEEGVCERCGAPFDGPAQHFHGTNAARYDAVYHWFKCRWCGKDIQEKHYFQSYYWYEHEDGLNLNCGGCGQSFDQVVAGASKPGGMHAEAGSGSIAGETVSLTAGDMTAAALHGNTEGLPMALVYAPRTGKATLRAKASADAKALSVFKDGTVVIVLEKGYHFTQVRVNGQVGYMLTAALESIDPNQLPLGEGMLIEPTTGERGATAVEVRGDASGKACKVDEWATGAMVIVWAVSEDGEWYEIEYEGVRGYVREPFLDITTRYDFSEAEADAIEEA